MLFPAGFRIRRTGSCFPRFRFFGFRRQAGFTFIYEIIRDLTLPKAPATAPFPGFPDFIILPDSCESVRLLTGLTRLFPPAFQRKLANSPFGCILFMRFLAELPSQNHSSA
jgi:hypothetical protein